MESCFQEPGCFSLSTSVASKSLHRSFGIDFNDLSVLNELLLSALHDPLAIDFWLYKSGSICSSSKDNFSRASNVFVTDSFSAMIVFYNSKASCYFFTNSD